MNDPKTHVDTHPSGHPNKTAVNAENPIFGRPADPVHEVSIQQAAVVQSEKHPRETVQSPLINEDVASPVGAFRRRPRCHAAAGEEDAAIFETKEYTDGSSATGVAPLPDLSPAQQDAKEAATEG